MHALLEYLGVTLSMVMLLIITNYSLVVFMRDVIHIEEEQLYTVAERIIDKILLTPGYPPDWGSNFDEYNATLYDFGLAKYESRTPYELDIDKVIRLMNLTQLPNPLLVNGNEVSTLLGLDESYGFKLEIEPYIKCNIEVLEYDKILGKNFPVKIKIKLMNYFGAGIPFAKVNVAYIAIGVKPGVGGEEPVEIKIAILKYSVTNLTGECIVDLRSEVEKYARESNFGQESKLLSVIIPYVNWHDIRIANIYAESENATPLVGYVVGNYLILQANLSLIPQGATLMKNEVLQVMPSCESLLPVEISELLPNDTEAPPAYYVINRGAFKYKVFRLDHIEDTTSHIIAIGQWLGGIVPIVVSRLPEVNISYGGEARSPANVVVLTRLAYISGFPYIVRFSLWRLSE